MNSYKKASDLRNSAKNLLDGKYKNAVLITVLCTLVINMASLFIQNISTNTLNTVYYSTQSLAAYNVVAVIFDIIMVAVNILLGIMNAGLALFYLNIACKQDFKVSDLFYAYKNDSKKALGISAAVIGLQSVCLLPAQYLLTGYLNNQSEQWLFYTIIALIIGVVVYVPVSLHIALAFYLMFDFPQYSALETLKLSRKLMKGHCLRLFCLQLSFVPLMILCLFSLGIGFLWLQPYMQMTQVLFFLDLMNPEEK